jgi:hypothetical protein
MEFVVCLFDYVRLEASTVNNCAGVLTVASLCLCPDGL